MNLRKVVRHLALIVALPGLCLMSVSPVAASTLSLPDLYVHDGLTFSTPLTYDVPHVPLLHLTFTTTPIVEVKPSASREVLAEKIISPAPKHLTLVQASTLPQLIGKAEAAEKDSEPDVTTTPRPKADQPLADTPAKEPKSTQAPTTAPVASAPIQLSNGGLNADTLFDMSNSYRASQGLPAFQKDDRVCQLAASRAPEVGAEIAEGHMHSGLRARNLPYRNSENIISYRTEEGAFNWWVNDKIHHDQLVGNYTYSCVACAGHACAQEFTNFQPK